MKNKPYPLYELPPIRSLNEMALIKAQEMPEQTAFSFSENNTLRCKNYRELYSEMIALAAWLYLTEPRGTHIAILGENSYEWILVFLAVVSSGHVAVPIDKELPCEEVKRLLGQADAEAIFCSEAYMDLTEGLEGMKIIPLSSIASYVRSGKEALENGSSGYPGFVPKTDALACIFFTSGTLEASKGVMLSHGNIAADINNTCKLLNPGKQAAALLPFHHAFGLIVGLMLFHYGCSIYINKSLKNVKKALQTAAPQTLFLVPLFIETFHKQIWDTARKEGRHRLLALSMKVSDCLLRLGIDVRKKWFAPVRRAFGGELRLIISGGAALNRSYIRAFRSWGIEILNGYGTTECSPCTAVNRNFYHRDGSVGLPIPDSRIRIGDDGEVFIAGPHVMLGYYNNTCETSQALKDGWYATGDLGFIDKDGFLTLTGRKKNLIILNNGENVSPEELENRLLAYPEVREALVCGQSGRITAEIYPDEAYAGDPEHFQSIIRQVNKGQPLYKQIASVRLRGTEFEKNTSMKIIRHKN